MKICIDFDGTCCTHEYPKIGKDIGAYSVIRKLIRKGHDIILFTMRSGNELQQAVEHLGLESIELYGINTNPTQNNWTTSPKAYGQLYIDDASLGCPLIFDESISDRPFVDWVKVESILIKMGILPTTHNSSYETTPSATSKSAKADF